MDKIGSGSGSENAKKESPALPQGSPEKNRFRGRTDRDCLPISLACLGRCRDKESRQGIRTRISSLILLLLRIDAPAVLLHEIYSPILFPVIHPVTAVTAIRPSGHSGSPRSLSSSTRWRRKNSSSTRPGVPSNGVRFFQITMANLLLTQQCVRPTRTVPRSTCPGAFPDDMLGWEDLVYLRDLVQLSGEEKISLLGGEPTLPSPSSSTLVLYLLAQ